MHTHLTTTATTSCKGAGVAKSITRRFSYSFSAFAWNFTDIDNDITVLSAYDSLTGRSGLVVARLPAALEGPGSNRTADKSLCFHESHCDMQL